MSMQLNFFMLYNMSHVKPTSELLNLIVVSQPHLGAKAKRLLW